MASAQEKALNDFRAKIEFERKFLSELNVFNKKIVREFTRGLIKLGNVIKVSQFENELEQLLSKHYNRVGKKFSNNIELPSNVEKTDEEESIIDSALKSFYLFKSSEQAKYINDTNQVNADEAYIEGNEQAREIAADSGESFSAQEAAVLSGVILSRKLKGRSGSIAATETQSVAEMSKLTEVSVLMGKQPVTTAISPVATEVMKEWVTFGDEIVRPAHVLADSQRVTALEPFLVGGELLMVPGDTSFGASLSNVINCRCAAVYDEGQISELRRGKL